MGRGLHCEFDLNHNLNTGNDKQTWTDVSITDVDVKFLKITRAYNSKAAGINSLFGRGWSVCLLMNSYRAMQRPKIFTIPVQMDTDF